MTCVWVMAALTGPALPGHAQESAQPPSEARGPAGNETAGDPVPGATLDDSAGPAGAPRTMPWSRGVPMAQREAARALFLEGNRLLDVPLFAQAAEKYQQALALWPHPAFHFNLALAQLNLVQPVEAYESFGRAMAHAPEGIDEEKQRLARDYRSRLEQQLGHVEVTCDQPGAAVTMDGRPLFTGPGHWQGVVVPGEHQILASADGFIPATRRVVVSASERAAVALALQRPVRTVTERYVPAWVPWASLGMGAAVLGVGGYMDRRSGRALNDLDQALRDECSRGCTEEEAPRLLARHAELEREQSRARLLYVTGGIVVTASVVLLYMNRERVVRREVHQDSISVLPMTGSDALGIAARLTF